VCGYRQVTQPSGIDSLSTNRPKRKRFGNDRHRPILHPHHARLWRNPSDVPSHPGLFGCLAPTHLCLERKTNPRLFPAFPGKSGGSSPVLKTLTQIFSPHLRAGPLGRGHNLAISQLQRANASTGSRKVCVFPPEFPFLRSSAHSTTPNARFLPALPYLHEFKNPLMEPTPPTSYRRSVVGPSRERSRPWENRPIKVQDAPTAPRMIRSLQNGLAPVATIRIKDCIDNLQSVDWFARALSVDAV